MENPPSTTDITAQHAVQQDIITAVLDRHAGQPEGEVERHLRAEFHRQGLPCPPDPWLQAVAGEITHDRLYVVAPGLTAPDDFHHRS